MIMILMRPIGMDTSGSTTVAIIMDVFFVVGVLTMGSGGWDWAGLMMTR